MTKTATASQRAAQPPGPAYAIAPERIPLNADVRLVAERPSLPTCDRPQTRTAPFGGVDCSGHGRELGAHGLEEFFYLKSIQL